MPYIFLIVLFSFSLVQAADSLAAKGEVEVSQAQLIVTAIDYDRREVTFKNEAGEERSFHIGEEARNLDQVKVGDIVTIQQAEGIAVRILPADSVMKGQIASTGIARSDKGEKPHVTITRHIELSGQIKAIDPQARLVTIEGKDGSLTTPVAKEVNLDNLKVGDMVRVDFMEMLSITVSSPQ